MKLDFFSQLQYNGLVQILFLIASSPLNRLGGRTAGSDDNLHETVQTAVWTRFGYGFRSQPEIQTGYDP